MSEQQNRRTDRTRILLIGCLSLFSVGLDITVVNVALPSIGRELHVGIADSLAPSVELLVAARVLQAVGASMLNPVAMSIITNLPVGVAAIVLTLRLVPESKAPRPRRFDPVGQLLVIALLSTLTFGIIEAPNRGWTSPLILAAFATAAAALTGLLLYEPRRHEPLVDLRFFRSLPFSSSITISVSAFAAFGGFLFLNTLYLQQARGLSPVEAGLVTVPMALMTVIAAPISGRIVGRRGPRLPLLVSGACTVTACAMLTTLGPATPIAGLVGTCVVFGVGFGLVNAPITNAAVSGMPRAQAGVASAIATTSRQVGQTLGVAVIGAIVTSHLSDAGTGAGLASASDPAWWTLTACGAAVLLLGFVATGRRARESAHRTAVQLNPEALAA